MAWLTSRLAKVSAAPVRSAHWAGCCTSSTSARLVWRPSSTALLWGIFAAVRRIRYTWANDCCILCLYIC